MTTSKRSPERRRGFLGLALALFFVRSLREGQVRLIVADDFAMLEAEMQGEPSKKSEHRKALTPLLAGRSDGSVEFKHQNISNNTIFSTST